MWKVAGYSPEFKFNVVKRPQKEPLSFRETVVRFNIPDTKVVKRGVDANEAVGKSGLHKRKDTP